MISTTFNSSAQNNDSKILVAYYSYSGNTKAVAEQIQKGTDGDLFEIQPIKPYSKNYQEVVDQAKKEISTPAATAEPITPEILLAIQYCNT